MPGLAYPTTPLPATASASEAGFLDSVIIARRLRAALVMLPLAVSVRAAPRLEVCRTEVSPAVTAAADDPAWRRVEWTKLQELSRSEGAGVGRQLAHSTSSGPQGDRGAAASRSASKLADPRGAGAATTEVAVLWNDDSLFVRFRCDGVGLAPYGRTHDAPHHEGEVVEVFIDPTAKHDGFMELQLSPAGGVMDKWWSLDLPVETGGDGLLTPSYSETHQRADLAWTLAGLRTATSSTTTTDGGATGWLADFALPWRALGQGRPKAGDHLRAHFVRIARPAGATNVGYCSWTTIPIGRPHRAPTLMGTLELCAQTGSKAVPAEGQHE